MSHPAVSLPDADSSALLAIAFSDANPTPWAKSAWCAALYLTLFLLWMPGYSKSVAPIKLDSKPETPRRVQLTAKSIPMAQTAVYDLKPKKIPVPEVLPDLMAEPIKPDLELVVENKPYLAEEWIPDLPAAPPVTNQKGPVRMNSVGVEPPVFVQKVSPIYPERARKVKIEGVVILDVVLLKNGEIGEIKVLKGLGDGKFGFEEAAMAAARQWRFLPGKVNGRPADILLTLTYTFSLR